MSELEGGIEDAFGKLVGQALDDAARDRLYRVRDALGIRNNDALWIVLMALQHYENLYEKFPRLIAQSAKEALVEFKVAADAAAKSSIEVSKADLTRSVGVMALELARKMNGKQESGWRWVAAALGAVLICVIVGALAYRAGEQAGLEKGRAPPAVTKAGRE